MIAAYLAQISLLDHKKTQLHLINSSCVHIIELLMKKHWATSHGDYPGKMEVLSVDWHP